VLREAWMEQKTKSQAWVQLQIWNQTPTWLFSCSIQVFFNTEKSSDGAKRKKSNLGMILNLELTPIWHFFCSIQASFCGDTLREAQMEQKEKKPS